MRLPDSRPIVSLLGILAIGLLAGCTSMRGNSAPSAATVSMGGSTGSGGTSAAAGTTPSLAEQQATFDAYLQSGYCPPVTIRPGTEALTIYEKGHEDDQNFVRYQGSITKTARECHAAGSSLMVKIGIAGRLTAGPKGTPGNFALPLRVAVVKQHGSTVFYTDVTKVPVSISAPTFASDYTTVVDNISFELGPDDRDLIIYVGFDEGKPKPPPPTG